MKNPDSHELIRRALKGKLSQTERQEFDRLLREDAAFREAWRSEIALERALDSLPDAPVSSNFTSLVVQAALRESEPPYVGYHKRRVPWFRFALPKLAGGLAATLLIGLTIFQQQHKARVREVAETVSDFNKVTVAIGPENTHEVFANFEAIQRLNLPAESELDMELLAALQ